jgi:hypothetical protein
MASDIDQVNEHEGKIGSVNASFKATLQQDYSTFRPFQEVSWSLPS